MLNTRMIREAVLPNHLANAKATNSKTNQAPADLLGDYQLQEALNLLKGLVVAQQHQPPALQAAIPTTTADTHL